MVGVEIADESMQRLWRLRELNERALRAITAGEGDAIDQELATGVLEISQVWSATSPYMTGTLSSAVRGEVQGGLGRVYIDPGVTNPISGGLPAEYGPEVHERKPWVANLVANDVPRIMTELAVRLYGRLDEIYRGQ
jgi:hypothetical protein